MIIIFAAIILLIAILVIIFLLFRKKDEEDYFYRQDVEIKSLPDIKKSYKDKKILIFNSYSYKIGIPEYARYSTELNKKYAEDHNYEYIQIEHDPSELPPYWLRVKDMYNLLLKDEHDVVIYLDLDAVFNTDKPITDIISEEYDMFIGEDKFPSHLKYLRNPINNLLNSGCFIVKNTEWSKSFIKKWLSICTENVCDQKWVYRNLKWECPDCVWAGKNYEQGSLAQMYLQNVDNAKEHVCIYSLDILANTNVEKESYVLHLMGFSDADRLGIFKRKYYSALS